MKRRHLLAGLGALPLLGADVPRPSPDFEVTLPDGKKINLSSYRGKVLGFACILTTWPHCQQHAQVMGAFYRQYKAKGFEALFAAVNDNANVPMFVQQYQVPFPVGTAPDAKAREYMQHTMVRPAYVPWLVFIDKKGIIRSQFTGVDAIFNQGQAGLAREVERLLVEPGPAPAAKKAAPVKKK